ncbi:MAG: site-specific integrase [Firmicutes bacterium]|nr:site-specific integrase [Bacillota bacterium]
MASIVQRGKSFAVVYYQSGRQTWETYHTKEQAMARKNEVEHQQLTGTFVPPPIITVTDLMNRFIETYGKVKWGFSTYEANVGLINNYILPSIGGLSLKSCTNKKMTNFFNNLREQKAVRRVGQKGESSLISERCIYEIYGLLNMAFQLAVEWEDIKKHPMTKSMKPTSTRGTRETWDAKTAQKAISVCESLRLLVYIHLALGCSMRIGEISGLLWDKVIFDEENNFEDAQIKIDTQLSRINREAHETLKRKQGQIKMVFPEVYQGKNYKTLLVLKEPKTRASIRTVYLPQTTAQLLYQWKTHQEGIKKAIGDEFQDYNLVMTLDNGRPIESGIIGQELYELIKKNNLPDVDFHSLRHTSTSVKLVITGGDIKGVQGDNGHGTAQMTVDTYAEIFDNRRKENAKKFDKAFFSPPALEDDSAKILESLVAKILKVPGIKDKLIRILKS